jgi:hypothetical protein
MGATNSFLKSWNLLVKKDFITCMCVPEITNPKGMSNSDKSPINKGNVVGMKHYVVEGILKLRRFFEEGISGPSTWITIQTSSEEIPIFVPNDVTGQIPPINSRIKVAFHLNPVPEALYIECLD